MNLKTKVDDLHKTLFVLFSVILIIFAKTDQLQASTF